MGLLRRIFGGGEATPEVDDPPARAPAKKQQPAKKKAAKKPAVDPEDPASRIDAARVRLREEIPPISDDEDE